MALVNGAKGLAEVTLNKQGGRVFLSLKPKSYAEDCRAVTESINRQRQKTKTARWAAFDLLNKFNRKNNLVLGMEIVWQITGFRIYFRCFVVRCVIGAVATASSTACSLPNLR